MEHRQVKSSSIESIGFSDKEQLLEVKFTSGAVYQYSGVKKKLADDFLKADSKGHFFQTWVRPCFPCERLHAEGCGKYLDCTVVNCLCFCHAKKENRAIPNPDLAPDLRKSIKQAKKKTKV